MAILTVLFEGAAGHEAEPMPDWYADSKAAQTVRRIVQLLRFLVLDTKTSRQRKHKLVDEAGLSSAALVLTPLKNFSVFFNPDQTMGTDFFHCIDAGATKVVLNLVDPHRCDEMCQVNLVVMTVHVMKNGACTCFRAIHVLEDGIVCGVLPIEKPIFDGLEQDM